MKVSHNQPHLVPPMKLVFYDEMPKSPGLVPGSVDKVSHWISQSKDFASRTSDRASLTIKKKLSKQSISNPVPIRAVDVSLRRQNFRPLELSIYLPDNRLSDLPEFGNVDFSDAGEIQLPPKALIRSRSDDMVQSFSKPTGRPIASMVGERQLDYWQQTPSAPNIQRPPSAYEALHSHPVCWTPLPGLPPQNQAVKASNSMTREENNNCVASETKDTMSLEFPPIREAAQHPAASDATTTVTALPPPSIQVPYKTPLRPIPARQIPSSTHTRISRWLSLSSSSSPSSDPKPASTRAPPPQFYQCAISPLLPQHQHQFSPSQSHPHSHTHSPSTTSTSTMSSPASSESNSELESLPSMTSSSTTAPTLYTSRSRSGTLRSQGKRVLIVQEEEVECLPELSGSYHRYAAAARWGKGS